MRRLGVACAVLLAMWAVLPAHAVEQQNKGLFVTPAREYFGATAGQPTRHQLTLANNTQNPLDLVFSVEQFTVTDYSYDFTFMPSKEDWLALDTDHITLQPGKSFKLGYTVTPPPTATPGGHYFTLFATATINADGIRSKVQSATTLYVTVQGKLELATTVQKVAIPRFAFGDIPFSLDVKDTGNTHFFVYASGELQGISARGKGPEATHLLMPNTTRTIGSSIPAPLLPGIYTAVYGYKTDAGESVTRTTRVVYLPPWSLCVAAGVIWLAVVMTRRLLASRHHRVRHR